jgi:hypothetical protein
MIGSVICTISITSICQPTYYMLMGICVRCLANCSVCLGPVSCSQCIQGFYLVNGISCLPCGANCQKCNGTTQCQTCTLGYYPVNNSNACAQCTGTGNIIYSVSNASCMACPNYCYSCDSQVCYYCIQGFYLSSDSTACLPGGSILCTQSSGASYIACRVDLYGCQSYSYQQYDTSSGTSVPTDVCMPRSFTSTSQINY